MLDTVICRRLLSATPSLHEQYGVEGVDGNGGALLAARVQPSSLFIVQSTEPYKRPNQTLTKRPNPNPKSMQSLNFKTLADLCSSDVVSPSLPKNWCRYFWQRLWNYSFFKIFSYQIFLIKLCLICLAILARVVVSDCCNYYSYLWVAWCVNNCRNPPKLLYITDTNHP